MLNFQKIKASKALKAKYGIDSTGYPNIFVKQGD